MRIGLPLVAVAVAVLPACQSARPAPFDPQDPAAVAAIDSLMKVALQGAASADADKVLAIAEGAGELTLVGGDELVVGLPAIREGFRNTYAGVARQDQEVRESRIRLLTPDVAVFTAVGEGTYTDKAGWTSEPVGLGVTVVFVKRDGRWQAQHVHQSVAR